MPNPAGVRDFGLLSAYQKDRRSNSNTGGKMLLFAVDGRTFGFSFPLGRVAVEPHSLEALCEEWIRYSQSSFIQRATTSGSLPATIAAPGRSVYELEVTTPIRISHLHHHPLHTSECERDVESAQPSRPAPGWFGAQPW
jgi:hypothetical protein